jgi:hypothetical protein
MLSHVRKPMVTGLAVTVALGLALAWFLPTTPASAGDSMIQVFEPQGPWSKLVDLGRKVPTAGDFWVELHPALDPQAGTKLGTVYNRLMVVKPVKSGGELSDLEVLYDSVVRLADGDVTFTGAFLLSEIVDGVTLPVTGGTGAYELARGTVELVPADLDGKPGGMITFDLTTT